MKEKILIGSGIALCVFAFLLFGAVYIKNADTAKKTKEIAEQVERCIEDTEQSAPGNTEEAGEETAVVKVGDSDYIGYIVIDRLGLELPVRAKWDEEGMQLSPCRQSGDVKTDDLVVAAHNYKSHFGSLHVLDTNDRIDFISADGEKHEYVVAKKDRISPDRSEQVFDGSYPLVLYTCTYTGEKRVVVSCDKVKR